MKLTLFFLLVCISGLFASDANSQIARVNIQASDLEASEIIRQIEEQIEYLFVYNHEYVDLGRKATIRKTHTPVTEVLAELFEDSDVIYAMEGNNILLMKRNDRSEKTRITGR